MQTTVASSLMSALLSQLKLTTLSQTQEYQCYHVTELGVYPGQLMLEMIVGTTCYMYMKSHEFCYILQTPGAPCFMASSARRLCRS